MFTEIDRDDEELMCFEVCGAKLLMPGVLGVRRPEPMLSPAEFGGVVCVVV